MMGAPDSRATVMTPSPARMRGPRGPSGVMPTYAPAFKVLSKVRRAAAPPRVVDPTTVSMPKWPTVRARICPSGCWEMSTEMERRRSQQ